MHKKVLSKMFLSVIIVFGMFLFVVGDGLTLYETSTNQKIQVEGLRVRNTNFCEWLPEDVLVVGDIRFQKQVVRVQTKQILSSFTGEMIGFDPKTNEILFVESASTIRRIGI